MDDLVNRVMRELPDTSKDRYDIAYQRGRSQANSSLLFGGMAIGLALGASAMYLLDPRLGRGRRVELAQQLGAAARDLQRTAGGRGTDLRNRAIGAATELGLPGTPPSNEQVREELAAGSPRLQPRSAGAHVGGVDEPAFDDTETSLPVGSTPRG